MRLATPLLAASLITLTVAALVRADPPAEPSADERLLKDAGIATDGATLLDFFRTRTGRDVSRDQLMALVRQLGDPDVKTRSQAAADLLSHGAVAIPVLRHAVNDLDNAEVAARARRCLELIDGPGGAALPVAAARLVAQRRPGGAAEVLLAYLPFSDDQTVIDEVGAALAGVAMRDGKANPALLKALDDPVPLRRATAATALCRTNLPEARTAVRKLLRDPRMMVRMHVALALAEQQDLEAIPVLIDLFADLPHSQCGPIEAVLHQLAGEWAPNPNLPGDDAISRKTRRDAWAGWWRNTDGPALLAEFRKRTLTPTERDRLLAMIHNLGDDVFAVREQANSDLVAYGALAVPLLREAARDGDPERMRRARDCVRLLGQQPSNALPTVAARLVSLRKPAGAVEVLLDYLPFADNETMTMEVQSALAALAMTDGKPDAVLMRALGDKLAVRRAVAAEALARSGGPEQRAAVCKLLEDADATVRFRTALALSAAGQKDAVPVLIGLLGEMSPDQSALALDFLHRLAGDKAPTVDRGSDDAGHRKFRDAWATWWKDNGASLEIPSHEIAPRLLGYTLVVLYTNGGAAGRVLELGRDGKPRWTIENVHGPVDAWVLGDNRVLIAEYNGNRVTERDFKGNIRWQKQNLGANVVNAQRMPNGNTFIATSNHLMEVDREGKSVFDHQIPTGVVAAARARNGHILYLSSQQAVSCVRLDAAGKELKTFPANRDAAYTSGIDLLPNGNVLIAQPSRNMVTEFTPDGNKVWEATVPQGVTTATRLSNGHTLVASMGGNIVVELDRAGKAVWEHKDDMQPFRARRR
jgi:HEAT repeat protein